MIKRYQSDLTDKQWAIINPLIPAEKEGGRPRATDMRGSITIIDLSALSIIFLSTFNVTLPSFLIADGFKPNNSFH